MSLVNCNRPFQAEARTVLVVLLLVVHLFLLPRMVLLLILQGNLPLLLPLACWLP